jgi:hypothetical protein
LLHFIKPTKAYYVYAVIMSYCLKNILITLLLILEMHVPHMGENRGVYRVLVGKPEGKRPPGRPRSGWEDNIKMDLQLVGYGGMDWIVLAQDGDRCQALVNGVLNLRVP